MSKNNNTYKTFNVNEKTPEGFYNQINQEFNFNFDPCPLNPNPELDGLKISWGGGDMEITAIENKKKIVDIYKQFFPEDKVIVTDAHQYLLDHYKEFDFIWSSPPCPTHSRTNTFLNAQGIIRYPDMALYQEIIFLNQWFKGKFVVENVINYYKPLIKPVLLGRHYFWTNFQITNKDGFNAPFNIANARATTRMPSKDDLLNLQKWHGFNLSKIKPTNARLLLRNCVYPPLGEYIFNEAFKQKQETLKVVA